MHLGPSCPGCDTCCQPARVHRGRRPRPVWKELTMQNLAGNVAVVTGAASGIGLAISRRLGEDGMRVMMADIEEAALVASAEKLAADGIEIATAVTDVSDPASIDALAAATLDRFGAVHVVCNNAGVAAGGPSWETPVSTWEW